jgi:hypothetical protein
LLKCKNTIPNIIITIANIPAKTGKLFTFLVLVPLVEFEAWVSVIVPGVVTSGVALEVVSGCDDGEDFLPSSKWLLSS